MAYATPPTYATGQLITAAIWNTYIKDNFAASVPDIFTAKGDIAVASAADVAAPLAIGTDGQLLTANSAATYGINWASPNTASAHARYKVSATRSVAGDATPLIINFDTSVYDTDSAVTTGAAWKFTVPASHGGYYLVASSILLESSAAWGVNEYLKLSAYVDGTIYATLGISRVPAAGTIALGVNGMAVIYMAAASYVDIRAEQNSGSAINIGSDGVYSHVSISRLFS